MMRARSKFKFSSWVTASRGLTRQGSRTNASREEEHVSHKSLIYCSAAARSCLRQRLNTGSLPLPVSKGRRVRRTAAGPPCPFDCRTSAPSVYADDTETNLEQVAVQLERQRCVWLPEGEGRESTGCTAAVK